MERTSLAAQIAFEVGDIISAVVRGIRINEVGAIPLQDHGAQTVGRPTEPRHDGWIVNPAAGIGFPVWLLRR